MNRQQITGSIKKVAGKLQKGFGEMVDSPQHVAKGMSRQVAGRAEKAVGDLRAVAEQMRRQRH